MPMRRKGKNREPVHELPVVHGGVHSKNREPVHELPVVHGDVLSKTGNQDKNYRYQVVDGGLHSTVWLAGSLARCRMHC
jgi:hypothetical protein